MKRFLRLTGLWMTTLACGCTLTVHPLLTPDQATSDAELAGAWRSDDTVWTFVATDAASGQFELRTEMKDQPPARFRAMLGLLGGHPFLELTPERPDAIHAKTFLGSHFLALHNFWKYTREGDQLTLTPMSASWLDALQKQGNLPVGREQPESGLPFFTASTADLHAFVAQHAGNPAAFPTTGDGKGIVFTREGAILNPTTGASP